MGRSVTTCMAVVGTIVATATGHDIAAMLILLALLILWFADN